MKIRVLTIVAAIVASGLVIGLINYKQQPAFLTSAYLQYKIGVFVMRTAQDDDVIFGDRFEDAAKYIALSIDKGNEDREAFYNLYRCNHMARNDVKAEETLNKAIVVYADDFEFHYLRGVKRKELKKYRLALNDFKVALTLDSVNDENVYSAFYDRGAMAYILGDSVAALKDWMTSTKLAGRELRDYRDYCQVWR